MAYNRSLIGIALAACTALAVEAYGQVTAAAESFALAALDAGRVITEFLMLPFRYFAPAPSIPLDHALHQTRADDIRRATPFKAFQERARQCYRFVGDRFRDPMICQT